MTQAIHLSITPTQMIARSHLDGFRFLLNQAVKDYQTYKFKLGVINKKITRLETEIREITGRDQNKNTSGQRKPGQIKLSPAMQDLLFWYEFDLNQAHKEKQTIFKQLNQYRAMVKKFTKTTHQQLDLAFG